MTWFVAVQEGIAFAADPAPIGGQAVVTAFVVVGLLAAGAWLLRHRFPTGRGHQLMTVETALSLGERRSLVVVAIENRRLLLGLTPQQISFVTELGQPGGAKGAAFHDALQVSLGGGRAS